MANTTYIASYHTGSGFYDALNYFNSQGVNSGTLHALQSGTDGLNGVYYYGPGGILRNQSYEGSNYYVDIVFSRLWVVAQTSFLQGRRLPHTFRIRIL